MVEVKNLIKDEFIRISPECGSITISQKPKPWEASKDELITFNCMHCNRIGTDFPLIKKSTVKKFRSTMNPRKWPP